MSTKKDKDKKKDKKDGGPEIKVEWTKNVEIKNRLHSHPQPSTSTSAGGDCVTVTVPTCSCQLQRFKYQTKDGRTKYNMVHKFWEKQPVMQIRDGQTAPVPIGVNEPIDPNTDSSKVRKEPLNLPEGFTWADVDPGKEEELQELYTLLSENYLEDTDHMFRFHYSRDFLQWALKPPGYKTEWFVGVRTVPKAFNSKGKLFGFISAIPGKIRVYEKTLSVVLINFLCVHKRLRSKRLAPVLIQELTRRVNLTGIWQALYTAGVFLPTPSSAAHYYHRPLNTKKLLEVGFSYLSRNMTPARMLKLYRLPEEPTKCLERGVVRLRRADFSKDGGGDLKPMMALFTAHMAKFDLVQVFDEAEFAYWLQPRKGMVETWVLEKPNSTTKKRELVAFFSFHVLSASVVGQPTDREVKAAYSYYNVAAEDVPLVDLMADALVVAKNAGMDVFNALDQMENETFLKELKFGPGDGTLYYYLFNWKCSIFKPEKVGVVFQ